MKFFHCILATILAASVSATTDGVIVDGSVVWQVESSADAESTNLVKRCTSCVGNGGPCIPGKGQCHNPKGCWSKNGGPFVCQCAEGGEFNYSC